MNQSGVVALGGLLPSIFGNLPEGMEIASKLVTSARPMIEPNNRLVDFLVEVKLTPSRGSRPTGVNWTQVGDDIRRDLADSGHAKNCSVATFPHENKIIVEGMFA